MMSAYGCELAGVGPIPAAVAREIMTNPAPLARRKRTWPH